MSNQKQEHLKIDVTVKLEEVADTNFKREQEEDTVIENQISLFDFLGNMPA